MDKTNITNEYTFQLLKRKYNEKKIYSSYFDILKINRYKKKEVLAYYEKELRLLKIFQEDLYITEFFNNNNKIKYKENDLDNSNRQTYILLSRASLIINIIRLLINFIASITSGSYSVISTFLDSFLDLTTGGIIHYANHAIDNTNKLLYPRGRDRLEILCGIICAVIMSIANFLMILNSIKIFFNDYNIILNIDTMTILILLFSVACKFLLLLGCRKINTPSSRVLSVDLKSDILTNIVAITGAYIGTNYWKYADPIGAILVCSWIVYSWYVSLIEQIPLIVGGQLKQEQYNRVVHLSINHDRRIKRLDHILVYYIGVKAQVEIYIIMDEKLTLKDIHTITEALKHKLNMLDFVERVFIHCDYKS
ncbi:Cation efflux protein family and Cation efflux protein transmembrane domain and Cation efflux protein cytoplasmic domain-containing protein [Strongyloides ratti]|uniref:Cation efflux protein family and Cation efflux protein transmembrane domain and Cation efflux protein cytoplasmic domain-containing protein n=1 Tax=Strongyloides ratti TaxID=34506 RepID=A0A090MVD6_STRRB|nr:Cation efflux protein family and Cation efflux protein transmembrane domain and Cation efflux protein cytoplasmic domain-containing protein [Strongyloides ratti]CEF62843.1 Cation efflux protein family and Cation efflux protein transmembrane domain and Cation efflux protein cytoplasmic domain-containing protein [Strongyloides ratti]